MNLAGKGIYTGIFITGIFASVKESKFKLKVLSLSSVHADNLHGTLL